MFKMIAPQRYEEPSLAFPLYKFTKREHAESFLSTGSIRLGTIYEYRDHEKYNGEIPDRHEGFASFLKYVEDDQGAQIPTIYMTHAINNWIYCCTETFDPKFYEIFDADCCYVINDIRFFNSIDNVMRSKCTPLLLRRIRYVNVQNGYFEGKEDFAGVLKDISFSHQKEIRACWETKKIPRYEQRKAPAGATNSLDSAWFKEYSNAYVKRETDRMQPLTIVVPEARKYCSGKLMLKP